LSLWIKMRRTHYEHVSSGLPRIADIRTHRAPISRTPHEVRQQPRGPALIKSRPLAEISPASTSCWPQWPAGQRLGLLLELMAAATSIAYLGNPPTPFLRRPKRERCSLRRMLSGVAPAVGECKSAKRDRHGPISGNAPCAPTLTLRAKPRHYLRA
jgi:hypothetical protein